LPDHAWKEEDECGLPTWRTWRPEAEPVWHGWRSYDEARQIADALEQAYEIACRNGARALVINLSIGAYGGGHDGRSTVERQIAEISERGAGADNMPCAVVVSAGNAGTEEGHFGGRIEPGRPLSFAWRM